MKKKPPIHAPPIAVGVARSEPEFPDRASLSRQVPVPVPVSRDFTLRSNVHRHPRCLGHTRAAVKAKVDGRRPHWGSRAANGYSVIVYKTRGEASARAGRPSDRR